MTNHRSDNARPADDDRVAPTTDQISRWASLTIIVASSSWYFATVLPQLGEHTAAEIEWQVPMLWAIGASVVGAIILAIVFAIVAAIVTQRQPENGDIRDKQIERHGNRVAQSIVAFGTLLALALAMLEVDAFWIGNSLFFVGAVGATVGTIVSIVAYRGVFRG
jgi:beta-lactamase regulating signal transducer with metallopeptidase domain